MELWDIYNMDRTMTGRTMVRGEKMKPGDYRMVVHICIFNEKGEMLIQQRQPFKDDWADMWDLTVGGSAVSGDSSQTAAMRELEEELGILMNLEGVRPNLTINFDGGFDDVYLIERTDIDISQLKLQYEEVKQVKWARLDEIFRLLDEGVFIPYYKSLIQLLFDCRRQYGCHASEKGK